MPQRITGTLKERKEREQRREQQIRIALNGRKKVLESSKRDKQHRKKTVSELLALLNTCGIDGKARQPAYTYVPRSHNLDRQLVGLLNHLFARYPVPAFLYPACFKADDDPFDYMHEMYRQWFVALAQGDSFPKLVKSFMTGKEAYVFLSAPSEKRIHENVWWAKMKVAGLPERLIERLIERIFGRYFFDDPGGRLAEVIRFYARYHRDMDRVTFGEVTDFLAWKLQNDRAFTLKGRTAASVVKLTNEWHVLMQKAKLGSSVEWKGLEIADWEFEARDRVWGVTQLLNNRELMNEGRKQKHCVYSYVSRCVGGSSAIFSLRSYRKVVVGYTDDGQVLWDRTMELSRVTIEVNSQGAVVQARGLLNQPPTDEEKKMLRQWAGEKGLLLRAG